MRAITLVRDYVKDRRGGSALEFVLLFPWFMVIVIVIIEFGLFFFATSTVEQAVHNYSRKIPALTQNPSIDDHSQAIKDEIRVFVGAGLVKSMNFELGYARSDVDFTRRLRRDWVDPEFLNDRTTPFYLRVVVRRPSFVYGVFKPLWAAVGKADIGGLFSRIDILIINPFPLVDG